MDFADPETAPTILPFTNFEITGESEMLWARLLAYVTGTVNQELLLRNEYLAACVWRIVTRADFTRFTRVS
jgi:hypothetical protein